jgi:alpha-D-ribose 1-methylphosphonate 5-triphosphate synthase subunit PhnL
MEIKAISEKSAPEASATPLLETRALRKRFQLHLLDGRMLEPFEPVSFAVRRAQLFLISGRSGAGKTSILKCIYRTYLASEGEIRYASQLFGWLDLANASEALVVRLRARELGYCSQFLKALPRVAALDILAEPLLRMGVDLTEAREVGARWLRRLGIGERLWQASPLTFSGGEQQRLNLARAFIATPRLLLLDEPTASLDPVSKGIVLEIIAEAKAAGVTIITVSHDREGIAALADDGFVLN